MKKTTMMKTTTSMTVMKTTVMNTTVINATVMKTTALKTTAMILMMMSNMEESSEPIDSLTDSNQTGRPGEISIPKSQVGSLLSISDFLV